MMNTMYVPVSTLVALLCSTSLLFGQAHSDVLFTYGETQIEVQPQAGRLVMPQVFSSTGGVRQATSEPGFVSEADEGAGTGPGDIVVYNVLDDLIFWSDGGFTEPKEGTWIRIANNPSLTPDTLVGAETGPQPGSFSPLQNSIGQSSPSGDFRSHVDFRLEPISSDPQDTPAFGAYGLKLSLSSDSATIGESEPFFIVYRFGIDQDFFLDALDDFERLLFPPPGLPGDFDRDGLLTPGDIDLLSQEVLGGSHPRAFDLDGDGLVTRADRSFWVADLARTFFGDADLNHAVEFADFLVVSDQFGQPGGWADGDFDGNGTIAFPDFLQLSSNFGKKVEVTLGAAVPEPGASCLAVVGLGIGCAVLRRRRAI